MFFFLPFVYFLSVHLYCMLYVGVCVVYIPLLVASFPETHFHRNDFAFRSQSLAFVLALTTLSHQWSSMVDFCLLSCSRTRYFFPVCFFCFTSCLIILLPFFLFSFSWFLFTATNVFELVDFFFRFAQISSFFLIFFSFALEKE